MDLTGVAIAIALFLAAPAPRAAGPPALAAIAAASPPRDQEDGPGDRWLGDDKYRHFFMSFGGTLLAYGAARSLAARDVAAPVALGAGAAAGIGKELRDRHAGRGFSVRDLGWDALGLLAAWALLRETR